MTSRLLAVGLGYNGEAAAAPGRSATAQRRSTSRHHDMSLPEHANTFAAVDLGSNSFHLLVARREHGELRVIDRIKEMVRLGGGLDRDGELDPQVQELAFACLARFGQRLRGIPDDNMRAIGTQTFRRMSHANSFLMIAETALGCSIDIISGREEARLIYLGVSQGVSGHDERRLVIDIGGGSTELVIGEGLQPFELESTQFGCVSLTRRFFRDGKITRSRWDRALRAVMAELQELKLRYRRAGWQTAIGSSGTIRAVEEICRQKGWLEKGVTPTAVRLLRDRMLEFESVEAVKLPGLSERRHPVLIGGLVMLHACFETLAIEEMKVSPYALREGMLHDLLGRLEQRDPRDKTVTAFKARYSVDQDQAERVKQVALNAFDRLAGNPVLRHQHRELLTWAADLHECGLSISHSEYHLHSAYLVEHSDMAGFTRQEQLFLAALIRSHRRAIPKRFARALPTRLHEPLRTTLFCLRLASILCRTRDDTAIPEFGLGARDERIELEFAEQWLRDHPLTLSDLQDETQYLGTIGLHFVIEAVPGKEIPGEIRNRQA